MQSYVCFLAIHVCVLNNINKSVPKLCSAALINANMTHNVADSLCYAILQIVTLALLEINLFLVITVLSQEIQTVNFGFRTSGDSILSKIVLLRQS